MTPETNETQKQVEYELLRQAQSGDMTAFAALQGRLEPLARRFAFRLIGADADDIVQEAFFALYMNLERIVPPEKLRPFLFRVIRNRCYDALRAQGRFEVVSLDEDDAGERDQTPSDAPPPDEATHWLMIYAEVQQAMADLPEMQRQALILYSEVGLSYTEIAETMNVGIGTVKSRLYYAKRNLTRRLSPETRQALDLELEDTYA